MKNKKLTIKDAKYLGQLKGGYCLSNKYINANSNLKWRCKKCHTWMATYANVKNKTWCPYCAKILKIRKCVYCQKEYTPTNNVQKF